MSVLAQARFYTSAHDLKDLPPEGPPEIAFAGRSNAGKSSALNTIANQTRLAFVSKTPGRTQLINYFEVADGFLVDLPGYGYAQVPEKVRAHWQQSLSRYLQTRRSLQGLVLIMDARHPLTKLDVQMLDWFEPTGLPVHVMLTKSDKLTFSQGQKTLADVRRALAPRGNQVTLQLFSSLKRHGVEEAEARILAMLREGAVLDAAPSAG